MTTFDNKKIKMHPLHVAQSQYKNNMEQTAQNTLVTIQIIWIWVALELSEIKLNLKNSLQRI